MGAFWEIIDPHDYGTIQYIAVLTPEEIETIRGNGYIVTPHTFSKKVYPWLKGEKH